MLNKSGYVYRQSRIIETCYDFLNYIESNMENIDSRYEEIYLNVLKSRLNDLLEQIDCAKYLKGI